VGRSTKPSIVEKLEQFPQVEWSDVAPRLSGAVRDALEHVLATLDAEAEEESE